jgi:hypothetical protein
MKQVINYIRKQNVSITKQLFGTCSASIQFSETKVWLLCFVDRASLYNPVNKANLVHYFP